MSQKKNTENHRISQKKKTEESNNSQLETTNIEKDKNPNSYEFKKSFNLYGICKRIGEVFISEGSWFTKFQQLGKLFIEICGQWFFKYLSGEYDVWKNFVSMFND